MMACAIFLVSIRQAVFFFSVVSSPGLMALRLVEVAGAMCAGFKTGCCDLIVCRLMYGVQRYLLAWATPLCRHYVSLMAARGRAKGPRHAADRRIRSTFSALAHTLPAKARRRRNSRRWEEMR